MEGGQLSAKQELRRAVLVTELADDIDQVYA